MACRLLSRELAAVFGGKAFVYSEHHTGAIECPSEVVGELSANQDREALSLRTSNLILLRVFVRSTALERMVLHEFCLNLLFLVIAKLHLPVVNRLIEEHDSILLQRLSCRSVNLVTRSVERVVGIGTLKHLVVVALAEVRIVSCQLRNVYREFGVVSHCLEVDTFSRLMQQLVAYILKFRQQHLLDVYLRIGEHSAILLRKSQTSGLHKQILAVFGSNIAEQFVLRRIGLIHLTCSNGDVFGLAHADISRIAYEEVAVASHILRVATCLEACGSGHRLSVRVSTTDCLTVRSAE